MDDSFEKNDPDEVNLNVIDNITEYGVVNSFRIGYSENEFYFDFGNSKQSEEDTTEIAVQSKIVIDQSKMLSFLTSVVKSIVEYEDEFGKIIIPKKE